MQSPASGRSGGLSPTTFTTAVKSPVCLGIQGIPAPELGDLGGHLNMPSLADPL